MGDIVSTTREISVTIKSHGGYDATWQVFRGLPSEVRSDLLDYCGLDPAEYEGVPLSSVALTCTQIVHGLAAASQKIGATVVKTTKRGGGTKGASTNTESKPAADEAQNADPWVGAEDAATESEKPNAEVYTAIASAESVDDIKKVYAKHKDAMESDEDLRKAWNERGKALKAAGK